MSSQPEVAVGSAKQRVEARLKVTGRAPFTADHGTAHGLEEVAHAVIVDSSVGRGRITSIDTTEADAVPGVVRVISHANAPTLPYDDNAGRSLNPPGERLRVFQDDRVLFFGQPVAVVVADTLEAAQHAARLVEVRYDAEDPVTDLGAAPADEPVRYSRGDAEEALGSAPVRLDLTYRLARNHHNPMEPHATVARWEGDRLTVWDKTQWVGDGTQRELSTVFGLPREQVRVISPYLGGAFGSALRCWPHVTIAALAARETGRPVKLVLTRRQLYTGTGFRPAYEYRLRIGADRHGRVLATDHDIRSETSSYETFTEAVTAPGQTLYRTPHVRQAYRTVPLDVNTPTWMRGPGFASGVHVLETALDELAHELGIDPIELRRRNEPEQDEVSGLPFSTRRLLECYAVGAREFGWAERNPTPGSTRDGNWLVGIGTASAVCETGRSAARASVQLRVDGTALVQSATSDMGPGTYTSMTQIAADELGVDLDDVVFRLGDSDLPPAPSHSGSKTTASVGSAVLDGARQVRQKAVELAVADTRSPLYGADPADVVVAHGVLRSRNDPARRDSYRALIGRNGRSRLEAIGAYVPPTGQSHSMSAYGAVFAEVGVDSALGLVRIRRMLAVYDVGRIINPLLADSQAVGGMVGGIGMALLERTVTDHRDGRIVNANLADYLVPVSADVHDLRAIFLDGRDDHADPLGVKGLGEVVQVGVAPAIANAVFHATGRRVRELPITVEALL
ncbi:xanthine dehydrogenase family protein molybdopterin-binding subunit [Micromonospora sp. NPDC126480]|uniref:xanthine dehydrogenase family protein molybdopterin-binding subunit n=1 Tax=Micromonospora sp. NPDC126480 TaxID=3155312 RepID=UPI00332FF2B5